MTKLNYQTNFSLHAGVPATRNERRRGQLSFIVQVSVAGRGTLAGGRGGTPWNLEWECAARFSKPWPYFTDQNIWFSLRGLFSFSINVPCQCQNNKINDWTCGVSYFPVKIITYSWLTRQNLQPYLRLKPTAPKRTIPFRAAHSLPIYYVGVPPTHPPRPRPGVVAYCSVSVVRLSTVINANEILHFGRRTHSETASSLWLFTSSSSEFKLKPAQALYVKYKICENDQRV